ncbi:ketopantoate reductase family protein [Pseudidiomarina taiwanensis]|uniref:Ketopantoate reductase C-terminal domain-containing protein n=1 Tax=Pseudidiomarina taiwanensis TaxID=337250 RepID=A0A432ZNZ1_9GAMM|nr:ketopantoate reductase C-terminal domain-containing protein [Pseudidiomarina taiwanensis]RUO79607.1 hypothetical protein CWI83_03680 [Pseudidiomarina taiwanensis]
MSWLIVGEGALSGLITAEMASQGLPYYVKTRGQAARPLAYCNRQQQWLPSFQPETWRGEPVSTIFAAIKAYQVSDFIAEWRTWEVSTVPLILSYNGMLLDEQQLLPDVTAHLVCTTAAERIRADDFDRLSYHGSGLNNLGWALPSAARAHDSEGQQAELLATLERTLAPVHWVDNIRQLRWEKLAINCLINPFTVIYRCRNGRLAELNLEQRQQQLAAEIVLLARQFGVTLELENLLKKTQYIIAQTASNRSSTLVDVLSGRPTEMDYLTGFVVAQSERCGLAAPHHQLLLEQFYQSLTAPADPQ